MTEDRPLALVTGGNGGIGLGMARGLAKAGCRSSWRSSARVRPCVLTPGTSSTQPTYHLPRFWMTAVYSRFM